MVPIRAVRTFNARRSKEKLKGFVALLVLASCTGGSNVPSAGPESDLSSGPSLRPSYVPSLETLPSPTVSPRGSGNPTGVDITVASGLRPNTGLRVGSEITVWLTFRSNGSRLQDLAGFLVLADGIVWKIVQEPPGAEQQGNLCGEVPEGSPRCGRSGASIRGISLRPNQSKTFTWVVRVVEYRCPGYGDFWSEIFAGHSGNLLKGPQSFQMFLLFDNEPDEYVKQKESLGQKAAPFKNPPCNPHYVGSTG